jgi:hypothetical protein
MDLYHFIQQSVSHIYSPLKSQDSILFNNFFLVRNSWYFSHEYMEYDNYHANAQSVLLILSNIQTQLIL